MRILPYKFGSRSAKALATALNTKRVRHDGEFRNNYVHPIINWGSNRLPDFPVYRWINNPRSVYVAANKLMTFEYLSRADVSVPLWETNRGMVQWEGDTVVRHCLNGHSGRGVEIVKAGSELPLAPLYVQYIKKQDEYRYHVFNGEVIDIQQKRKRREVENDDVDYQVRNAGRGWVYCREDINPDDSLYTLAIDAVTALGLDFGAVDIIWNNHQQQGYVLEVNTACGLEGTTVDKYAEAIREAI